MRDAIALVGLLDNANIKAFLHTIRVGEGTADPDGYRRHFGGELFDSFADHPHKPITKNLGGKPITSTAAGAYQFLARTWDECEKALGLGDFSPANQDIAALYLIDRRKALDDVIAGRFNDAVAKCNREWASLPGSPYGQPVRTWEQARATYAAAGGSTNATSPTEAPMLPFIAAAIPALIQAAPSLIRMFGDSPQAEKNAKAAEVVATIAKQATGETTVEGAVNAIANDPAKAAAYREAVHQSMGDLLAVMSQAAEADDKSADAAMDRNLELGRATNGRWLWLLGAIAVIVITASYLITWQVLFNPASSMSDETKALLIGQIVIFGFATVLGFLFGSNIQNRIAQAQPKRE